MTLAAPGRLDLLDGTGAVAASLVVSMSRGVPSASASAAGGASGTVSGLAGTMAEAGAMGSPAEGTVTGSWSLSGLAPGAYVLRAQDTEAWNPAAEADTIWTTPTGTLVAAPATAAPATQVSVGGGRTWLLNRRSAPTLLLSAGTSSPAP